LKSYIGSRRRREARETLLITRKTSQCLFESSFRLVERRKTRGRPGKVACIAWPRRPILATRMRCFSHATAPPRTLRARGLANPTAVILSAAMMLDWLGDKHSRPQAHNAALRLEAAVDDAFAKGLKPREFGGRDGTAAIA
jgi:hypothetical protein